MTVRSGDQASLTRTHVLVDSHTLSFHIPHHGRRRRQSAARVFKLKPRQPGRSLRYSRRYSNSDDFNGLMENHPSRQERKYSNNDGCRSLFSLLLPTSHKTISRLVYEQVLGALGGSACLPSRWLASYNEAAHVDRLLAKLPLAAAAVPQQAGLASGGSDEL